MTRHNTNRVQMVIGSDIQHVRIQGFCPNLSSRSNPQRLPIFAHHLPVSFNRDANRRSDVADGVRGSRAVDIGQLAKC